MKKNNLMTVVGLLIALLITSVVFTTLMINREEDKKEIYLILKTIEPNIGFWDNLTNGAQVAATELDVEVIVTGVLDETDVEGQTRLLRQAIAAKPAAIVIAAGDYEGMVDVCNEAFEAGIPLITIDSDVNIDRNHSLVATNNIEASKRIGFELGTLMKGSGDVAVFAHVEGVYTAIERIEGFLGGIAHNENIHVLEDIIYCHNSRQIAKDNALRILQENPNISALYATNEQTLLGVADAVNQLDMKEKIIVVGFDINEEIAYYIEKDIVDVTLVQDSFSMGYLAIQEAIDQINREEPETIDTDAIMINKENMFLTKNQKLLVPTVK